MKRGRKPKGYGVFAPIPDRREAWQIEQGARCGCRGVDDLCACQNENPWPRPVIDWQARAQSAEAELSALKARVVGVVKPFAHAAEPIIHDTKGRWNLDGWIDRQKYLTVGQFRTIAALLSELTAETKGEGS